MEMELNSYKVEYEDMNFHFLHLQKDLVLPLASLKMMAFVLVKIFLKLKSFLSRKKYQSRKNSGDEEMMCHNDFFHKKQLQLLLAIVFV